MRICYVFIPLIISAIVVAGKKKCSEKPCRSRAAKKGKFDCWAGNSDPFACTSGYVARKTPGKFKMWKAKKLKFQHYMCCPAPNSKNPIKFTGKLKNGCTRVIERRNQYCMAGMGRGVTKVVRLGPPGDEAGKPEKKPYYRKNNIARCPAGQAILQKECVAAAKSLWKGYRADGSTAPNKRSVYYAAEAQGCYAYSGKRPWDWHAWRLYWNTAPGKKASYFYLFCKKRVISLNQCAELMQMRKIKYFVYRNASNSYTCEPYSQQASNCSKWIKSKSLSSYKIVCEAPPKIKVAWKLKQTGPVDITYVIQTTSTKTSTNSNTTTDTKVASVTDKTEVEANVSFTAGAVTAGGSVTNTKEKNQTDTLKNEIRQQTVQGLASMARTTVKINCPVDAKLARKVFQWTIFYGDKKIETSQFVCLHGGKEPRCLPHYCHDKECQTCQYDQKNQAVDYSAENAKLNKKNKQLEKKNMQLKKENSMFKRTPGKNICPAIKTLLANHCAGKP